MSAEITETYKNSFLSSNLINHPIDDMNNKHGQDRAIEAFLALRAVFYIGKKYTCPCCGWKLRAFTHGGYSLRVRPLGYCPRCNSKARHRRWWLFLQQHTNLFTQQLKLFQVSPNYCLSRRFRALENLNYVAGDLHHHRNILLNMALPHTPIQSQTFDAVLCIHVLEHISEDRNAIRELYRILKPGGWAGISVPIHLDRPTFEDPTITSPADRERLFGETVHVRYYGYDLLDRLLEAGFKVEMFPGTEVDPSDKLRYGLRQDEHIFYCMKQ